MTTNGKTTEAPTTEPIVKAMTMEERLAMFRQPLLPHEIEWKIAANSKPDKNGITKSTIVPYIDNRAVMNRLDAAFGAMGWKSEFHQLSGGFLCTIFIRIDGEWVGKSDGASSTDIEPIKGGISDAMKRAAHQWGIGRELYSYPTVQIAWKGQPKRWVPNPVLNHLAGMTTAINEGRFSESYVALLEDGSGYR